MLFSQRFWPGLADGTITVAFRRWARARVKAGSTLQTPAGVLAIDGVEAITEEELTDSEAQAAGHSDRGEALAALRPQGDLYRIRFHRAGDDPRIALRAAADLDAAELQAIGRALARLPWAHPTLELIAEYPATVSTELAGKLGLERLPFKQRVRRLKSLGLTESLTVGYRLSPRGRAVLAHLAEGDPAEPA